MISLWGHKINVVVVPFRFQSSKLLHLLFQTFIRMQALVTNAQLSDRQLKRENNEKNDMISEFFALNYQIVTINVYHVLRCKIAS